MRGFEGKVAIVREQLASATSPHDDRTADLDLISRALDRLTVADRTLLALHHFEHLSLAEIGIRLSWI